MRVFVTGATGLSVLLLSANSSMLVIRCSALRARMREPNIFSQREPTYISFSALLGPRLAMPYRAIGRLDAETPG